MPLAQIDAVYAVSTVDRFCQGDILRDVTIVEWAAEVEDAPPEERFQITDRHVPYVIVLTQDCDLEQDHANRSSPSKGTQDKYLQSILVCPAYQEADFRQGSHLEELHLQMERFSVKSFDRIKKNQLYRYHYLPANLDLQVPELVVDFKHYFTGPRDRIYDDYRSKHYLATLEILFRDDLSSRFAHYLSRIGLPEIGNTS